MKKVFSLIIALSAGISAYAQYEDADGRIPRLFGSLNFNAGQNAERASFINPASNYTNAVRNYHISRPDFDNEMSYGFDFQLGYFFDKHAHFGIATGIMYSAHKGTMTVDYAHVEYQSTDFNGDVFRQVITSTQPMKESLKSTNLSIPLVVKYRGQISKVVGVMVDAGALYNVKMETDYDATAAFRYEAIYQYVNTGNGVTTAYDANVVPNPNDWLMTLEQYQKNKGDGNEAAYFESLSGQGFNVALNKPVQKSGTKKYQTGSLGFILQPSFTFRLNQNLYLNLGAYYTYQEFSTAKADNASRITDKVGTYNSYLNNTLKNWQNSYGLKLGINVFL